MSNFRGGNNSHIQIQITPISVPYCAEADSHGKASISILQPSGRMPVSRMFSVSILQPAGRMPASRVYSVNNKRLRAVGCIRGLIPCQIVPIDRQLFVMRFLEP